MGLHSFSWSSAFCLCLLNFYYLFLFPWTLSTLFSPGLIWYSTNWLHQKVIKLHIIVTLFTYVHCSPFHMQSCFTSTFNVKKYLLSSCLWHQRFFVSKCRWHGYTVFCSRKNFSALFPQSHWVVWAAEEARPRCSVPDSSLPRQNFTQVRPTL